MILTLLICCFLGLGALQPSCAASRTNENNIVQSDTKYKHNYVVSDTGYHAYGTADVCSSTFITNVVLNAFNNLYPYDIPVGSYRSLYDIYYDCAIAKLSEIDTSASDLGFSNMHQLAQPFEVSLLSKANYSSQFYYLQFEFTFYTGANGVNADLTFKSDFMVDKRNAGPYHLGEVESIYDIHSMYDGIAPTIFVTNSLNTISYFENNLTYEHGYNDGLNVGQQRAYNEGYDLGYSEGQQNGNQAGYNNGYNAGLSYGETHPNQNTYDSIYNLGNQEGYAQGLSDAQAQSTTASQIFAGCVEVGLLPVNVFLKMFEYEVFGINIAGFVSALMTIAIVVIIIRMVMGNKNDK